MFAYLITPKEVELYDITKDNQFIRQFYLLIGNLLLQKEEGIFQKRFQNIVKNCPIIEQVNILLQFEDLEISLPFDTFAGRQIYFKEYFGANHMTMPPKIYFLR